MHYWPNVNSSLEWSCLSIISAGDRAKYCVISSEGIIRSLNSFQVRMPSGSIVICDEYGIDGLTWVLEVFFVPVCEYTGSGFVEGTNKGRS